MASRVSGRRRGRRDEDEIGEPWSSLAPRVYDRVVARVLLATDGSAEAEAATQVAVEQAEAMGSEPHVVHVGRLPNFLMQDPGVVGPDCKLYGELERESRERLRSRAIAGSVSDSVVGHSRCPVLVVSPGARRGSSMGRFEAAGKASSTAIR